jgi:hypothetical protein
VPKTINVKQRSQPLAAAIATFGFYLVYLVIRVLVAAGGNITKLALVGTVFSGPGLPSWIARVHGSGYDGQFYLRLALSPFTLKRTAFGITFDVPFRAQRIGYPFASWLLGLGLSHLIPFTMVAVNLLAVATIAYQTTKLLAGHDYSTLFGIAAALYFGYALSTGRDLAEPTAAALALTGMVIYSKNKFWLAGVLFALASLTLETELIIPVAIGIVWLYNFRRKRSWRESPAFLIPGIIQVAWQIYLKTLYQHFPASNDLLSNLGIPVFTPLKGLVLHLHPLDTTNLLWLLQLATLVAVVIQAAMSLRRSSLPDYVKVAWTIMVALTLSLSGEIWYHSSYFRAIDLVWLLSLLLWGSSQSQRARLVSLSYLMWLVSVLPLTLFL